MELENYEKIGLQLAAAIYLEDGNITYEEMKAIPFFTEKTDIKSLYDLLQGQFYTLKLKQESLSNI